MRSVKDITDFVMTNTTYDRTKWSVMKKFIEKHLKYKTCIVVYDKDDNIVAFSRWNISPDGKDVFLLDTVLDKSVRFTDLIYKMWQTSLPRYPDLETVSYEKGYDDGKKHKPIKRFDLKRYVRRFKNVQNIQKPVSV